ncbi:unnamed protein product [Effrenium voratum]|uniref:Uncharacterized protein n=1 Tax=Effrenium voratum TaxID=2562239 RepID=A0AA36MPY5_9DINO|nr:unnamed protein product [Effrenium voratum]CAJ1381000.1 unnamed protein product [Effrenium voratum]|mmetsp:Transcript_104459/g.248524  ORF Transcript_104459/g.248524 Transcript_104459/m.248524 type:complete len:322 (+) Transcript_104459:71-1036(+)|eukprot:CAMPEP_0181429762 /NCGR_PEP_ID=MMETSP1110-20121109/17367_1 /TAXON_ID=174948 /ORGANISM="Symbiodinium sp., Strain CCMP421" /LENGTH=321 /DNA_ID=CAMNT_0023553041 /DNA_START=208 /DNA_END=1173 /DNA_ORIENTATION=+
MAEVEFVPLTHEILSQSLSNIHRAASGGFAFTKLDCSNKELTELGNKVENYTQLRHVILSNNKLNSIDAVTRLPHLLTLQFDNNEVNSLECLAEADLPWCQRIDFTVNKLSMLPSLAVLGRLRFACFASNEISSLEGFDGHPLLQELQLQENKLTSLKGLGRLESLRTLIVSGNQLTSLQGLDAPMLKKLDVSKNQLSNLEHLVAECQELDIAENQLNAEDPNLPELRRLSDLKKLHSLNIAGNAGDLRVEVVVVAPQVQIIDGELVTEEDREAAAAKEEELSEAVKAKAEEDARLAAEAEAAAAEAAAEENAEADAEASS